MNQRSTILSKYARVIAFAFALAFAPLGLAQADEVGGEDISVPAAAPAEASVTAPPPAHVNLETTSIAAGLGVSWGDGTLSFEGKRYPFSVKGLSLGDLGAAKIVASGGVENIQSVADFEGQYMAVEAGASLGRGASVVTMRNANGVTLTLETENSGAQLTLAAKGISVSLQ
jgi:hypothetical protein